MNYSKQLESLFANRKVKVEVIHGEQLQTRADAKQHVFEYIEVYYNRKHSFIPNWAIYPRYPSAKRRQDQIEVDDQFDISSCLKN